MEELTNRQIERQDIVDNVIYSLVNGLIPYKYADDILTDVVTPDGLIDWNIEWISRIREIVQDVIYDNLDIPSVSRDEFEMEFYPYIELTEE